MFFMVYIIVILAACDVPEASEVIILFDTNGGSEVDPLVVDLDNLPSALPSPEKEGYEFDGWYSDEDLSNVYHLGKDSLESDLTLYASWVPTETMLEDVVITFYVNDVLVKETTIKEGEALLFPETPTLEGYLFDGWYTNQDFTNGVDEGSIIEENTILYAKFINDVPEESIFEQIIDENLTEVYIENVLIVDKLYDEDTLAGADIVVISDKKHLSIIVIDIEAEVGDVISFNATIDPDIYFIMTVDDLVIHSSDNPVIIETKPFDLPTFTNQTPKHPYYTELEGFASWYSGKETRFSVRFSDVNSGNEPEELTFYNIDVTFDEERPDFGYVSCGAFIIPLAQYAIYSEQTMPYTLHELSDEEMLEKAEIFLRNTYVNTSFEFAERIKRQSFYYALESFVDVSYRAKKGFEAYFDAENKRFLYSEITQDIPLIVELRINDVVRTFELEFNLLAATDLIPMQDLFDTEEKGYFEATVLTSKPYEYNNYLTNIIISDGTSMVNATTRSDIVIEAGKTYIFKFSDYTHLNQYDGIYYFDTLNAIQETETKSIDLTPLDYTWETLKNEPSNNLYIVTLQGTLEVKTRFNRENIVLTNETEELFLGIIPEDMETMLFNNYIGSTVEITILYYGYNEYEFEGVLYQHHWGHLLPQDIVVIETQ